MEYMQIYIVVIDAFGRVGDLAKMEYIFRLMKSDNIIFP
jgi:pentatricopeptide repeat protein